MITRATYRFNGRGFLDTARPGHIWTVSADDGADRPKPQPVTSGEFEETSPAFSPDGGTIFFVSNRVKEPYYDSPDSDIYSVPVSGGPITRAASIDGTIGEFALSADGKRIAFQGVPRGRRSRALLRSAGAVRGGGRVRRPRRGSSPAATTRTWAAASPGINAPRAGAWPRGPSGAATGGPS